MQRIEADEVPELEGTDVITAKKFFEAISEIGATFHADDVLEASDRISSGAANKINAAMKLLHNERAAWPDPDFIYDLAGEGSFKIEKDYPGFILDASIPAAGRTGYVSVPGQRFPTIVVEEMSQFMAIQIEPGQGRLSEATRFRVIPVEGASFNANGGRGEYISVWGAELQFAQAVEVASLAEVEDALSLVSNRMFEAHAPKGV